LLSRQQPPGGGEQEKEKRPPGHEHSQALKRTQRRGHQGLLIWVRQHLGEASHEGCEAPLVAGTRLAGGAVDIEASAEALAQVLLGLFTPAADL